MRTKLLVLAGALLVSACASGKGLLPAPTNTAERIYMSRVFVGSCVSKDAAADEQKLQAAPLFGTIASSLVSSALDKGFDAVAAWLKELGETDSQKVVAVGEFEYSANGKGIPRCIQFARGWFFTHQATGGTPVEIPGLDVEESRRLRDNGAVFAGKPDLFVEFAIRNSKNSAAMSLGTTLLFYRDNIATRSNLSSRRGLIAQVKFFDPAEMPVTGVDSANSIPLSLGNYEFGDTLIRFGGKSPDVYRSPIESGWVPRPFGTPKVTPTDPIVVDAPKGPKGKKAKKGKKASGGTIGGTPTQQPPGVADATAPVPKNVQVILTEVRDAEPFAQFLASILPGAKKPVSDAILDRIDPARIATADQAAITAATTFATKLGEAEQKRFEYCALETGAKNFVMVAAQLYGAQIAANQTAGAARQQPPYAKLVDFKVKTKDPLICP